MKKKLVSNVVLIGLVSLFMDMSTEMVYPLVPLYLTAAFGATPAIIGIIEGIAESIASFLKVFSGYVGDVFQNKKKLVLAGYSASVVYKILLLLSTSWIGVLIARIVDRTGKGIRTAPRDALVAQSCGTQTLGGSFGLHKMLDMAGSAFGVVLAYLFVTAGYGFPPAFLYSVIPAVLSILVIFAVKEKKNSQICVSKLSFKGLRLNKKMKFYLAAVFVFCIGNSSNAFLLLKAQEQGFTMPQVVLLYLAFNVATSLLAFPAGKFSDKYGRSKILIPGYLIYGLVYFGFAFVSFKPAILLLFIAYGAYQAFISGAERAFIAENSPSGYKGTVLGLYGMMQGIGLLFSSVIAGFLWDAINPSAPFLFGGILGIISAIAIKAILNIKSLHPDSQNP